jgi:predicted ribosome-associated RNA-binding protein Tma20
MRKLCILACLAALPAAAQSAVTREDDYWVRTLTGVEALPPEARLQVVSEGAVVVTGADEARLRWQLKARTRAEGEAEARRRLESVSVNFSKTAGKHLLAVHRGGAADAGLKLVVPRSLPALAVITREGSVNASGLASDSITLASGAGAIHAGRLEGNLVARTAGGAIDLGEIRGSARCSTAGGNITARHIGGNAVLETGGGEVDVNEIGGDARAESGGGRVRIGRAGAQLVVSTGGGRIEIGEARGMLVLRSAAGAVHVGAAPHGVRCETAGGPIHLSKVAGSLRASTTIGNIVAQLLANRPLEDSFLSTARGDITVLIPSNLSVKIHAANELSGGSRRIVSDFAEITTQVRGAQVVAEGVLNGGGPLLRIIGTGGTIFIKRQ